MKKIVLFILMIIAIIKIDNINANEPPPDEPLEIPLFYRLTYPDGSEEIVLFENSELEQKLNEWKLLYTGITNENGQIVLENYNSNSDLKIIESKVPEGYTSEKTEFLTNTNDKQITITNKKIQTSTKENNTKSNDINTIKNKTNSKNNSPKTNVVSNITTIVLSIGVITFSLGIIALFNQKFKIRSK